MMAFVMAHFIDLIVNRPWRVATVSLLLAVAVAAGLQNLIVVDVGIRNHFSENDPHLVNLERFEDTYAVSDTVLVVVDPPGESIFSRHALVIIEQLTDALWNTPFATRVDSLTNYSHSEGIGDDLLVDPLVEDAASLDDLAIARVQEIALNSMETRGRFVSRDGGLGGLVVSLVVPEENRQESKVRTVETLREIIKTQSELNPDTEYHIYGELLIDQEIRNALNHDSSVLGPAVLLAMIAVATIVLRSAWGVLGIIAVLATVMTSGMGFAGWVGLKFYGESGGAIFVLMAIAVAHSVHLIQGMMDGMREGKDRRAATRHALQVNLRPIFLTSVTTAIGFLSLNFSDMPPFQVLGNIVAFGSMCAFIYSVTLLPAMMCVMPMRVKAGSTKQAELFTKLASFVVAKSRILIGAFVIITMFSAIGIARIELNDNNLKLLNEANELRQSADFISERFSGLDVFEYSLDSGREGGVTDIDYLQRVDSFASWLRTQPEVSHVTSIADIMKRLNRNLRTDIDNPDSLPENSDLAAQYLLLYEFSLPVGLDLNQRINFERSSSRLTAVIDELSVREQIELDQRASQWLQENTPEIHTMATGVTIIGAYSVILNIERMLIGTIAAMSVVSLILVFIFKSVRLGLLSLIPNFLPAVMAMAIWGFAVGTVSVAASIVTAIAFGIIVDDTIHIMSKYLRSRAEGLQPRDAIAPTFRMVGGPLLTTTLIFAIGFLVFGLSDLATNQTLGTLVGITVVIALAADFLLFPPLLVALDRIKNLPVDPAKKVI